MDLNILTVVFRENKKDKTIEMFYYNDRKDLECFSLEYAHNIACYQYYIQDTKLIKDSNDNRIQKIINYYQDDTTLLRIKQKLSRDKLSVKQQIKELKKYTTIKQINYLGNNKYMVYYNMFNSLVTDIKTTVLS